MALPGVSSLVSDINSLSPTNDQAAGMAALGGVIANYMDQVQAGPLGSPGILTFNSSEFATQLGALPTVDDTSWITGFASAWETALLASTITPSTVSDPATWPVSSTDTLTASSPSSTITTISTAKSTLISGLGSATPDNNPPEPFAQAIHDAILQFQFNTIGVAGTPSSPVPTPVLRPAE